MRVGLLLLLAVLAWARNLQVTSSQATSYESPSFIEAYNQAMKAIQAGTAQNTLVDVIYDVNTVPV